MKGEENAQRRKLRNNEKTYFRGPMEKKNSCASRQSKEGVKKKTKKELGKNQRGGKGKGGRGKRDRGR